jgi:hypothetical protein
MSLYFRVYHQSGVGVGVSVGVRDIVFKGLRFLGDNC